MTRSLSPAPDASHVPTSFLRLGGAALTVGGASTTVAWLFLAAVDPGRAGHAEAWWLPLNVGSA